MDIPLHLRLACAGHFADPYADPRRRLARSSSFDEDPPAEHQNPTWFSSLLWHMEQRNGCVAESPLVEAEPIRPSTSPVTAAESLKAQETAPCVEAASASHTPAHSTSSPVSLVSLAAEEVATPQQGTPSVSPFTHRLSSSTIENVEVPNIPRAVADREKAAMTHNQRAIGTTDVTVQADVAADALLQAHNQRVEMQLAGTDQVMLADLTSALQRRLQKCVLQTLSLDDANHQLVCAFQLPPATTTETDVSPELLQRAECTAEGKRADLRRTGGPPAADGAVSSQKINRASLSAIAANGSDATISEEARKELAMHLYALRHQVVQMRRQLDTHEAAHARQVNASRAATCEASLSPSARPPVRVEIVKAYTDEPVPYRKGPWRQADFAAATSAHHGDAAKEERGNAADASYSSDQFTSDTSSALESEIQTSFDSSSSGSSFARSVSKPTGHASGRVMGKAAASGKRNVEVPSNTDSDSSTEDLFRKRQEAALQARAKRSAASAASRTINGSNTQTAARAASLQRNRYSTSTSTSTSSYSSTASSYTSLTQTSTTATTDTS